MEYTGKTLRILKEMDRLIERGNTGTPSEFAEKLNIGRSSFYFHRNIMLAKGAPLVYSRTLRSYYYADEGNFFIGFLPKHEINMLRNIKNGASVRMTKTDIIYF